MKRISYMALALAVASTIAMAGATPRSKPAMPDGKVDIDLAKMNSTMVYAQIFDMVGKPDSYRGKTVRMRVAYATAFPDGGGRPLCKKQCVCGADCVIAAQRRSMTHRPTPCGLCVQPALTVCQCASVASFQFQLPIGH